MNLNSLSALAFATSIHLVSILDTASAYSSSTNFANSIVPAPAAIADSFTITPSFTAQHQVIDIRQLDARLSEAAVGTFCLDQCIAYHPNATRGPCLSFQINLGKPVPPTAPGGPTQWFCSGFDAPFAADGSDFEGVDIPGSYMFPLAVNRVLNGTFRFF